MPASKEGAALGLTQLAESITQRRRQNQQGLQKAQSKEQEPGGAHGSLIGDLCPSFPSEKGLFKIQWLCSSLA